MLKKVVAIIGLMCLGLAAWPAWADRTAVKRLGPGVATAIAVSPDGASLAVGASIGMWCLSADTLAPLSFWDTGQWIQAVQYRADGHYLRADDRYFDITTGTAARLAPADLKWLPASSAPGRDCSPDGRP
jgi:hypothetical protein